MGTSVSDMAVLRHTLGLDWAKKPYRNHFAAANNTDDYRSCERLVEAGLMSEGDHVAYGRFFHATKAGEEAATKVGA